MGILLPCFERGFGDGAKNRDLADTRAPKLAMTPALMRELKDRLKWEKLSRYIL